jgi:hypothetical protein
MENMEKEALLLSALTWEWGKLDAEPTSCPRNIHPVLQPVILNMTILDKGSRL